MKLDSRLNDMQKCETLFGLSYGDGNGVSNEEFNSFMDGNCVGRDYSAILAMIESVEEEFIEEIFEDQGEEYLQCSKCDDLFTSNEDYDVHKSVDHGEEPEDFEESDETYKLTMNIKKD